MNNHLKIFHNVARMAVSITAVWIAGVQLLAFSYALSTRCASSPEIVTEQLYCTQNVEHRISTLTPIITIDDPHIIVDDVDRECR